MNTAALIGIAWAEEACHDARIPVPRTSQGEQIAQRRKRLGWNQRELSKRSGVGMSTVLRIEKDRNTHRQNYEDVIAALEKEERARGVGTTLSGPPAITEPSKEGADAAAKLRQIDARLERIELFLAETLEDVRRARAVLAPADSSDSRKRG